MRTWMLVITGLAAVAGCGGDDPIDVTGDYTVAVTSGENGCEFPSWNEGQSQANIPVSITQNDESANATVEGAVGTWLNLVLGDDSFVGTVDGGHLALRLTGTTMAAQGTCDYTIDAIIHADLDGDFLEGEIHYEPQTDGSDDCGILETCTSVQAFNGTRPPS